jgi:hypothetical protein
VPLWACSAAKAGPAASANSASGRQSQRRRILLIAGAAPHPNRRFKACNNPMELSKFPQYAIANYSQQTYAASRVRLIYTDRERT